MSLTVDDRVAMRRRPAGVSVMRQTWENLLFLHWPVPVERLRPLIPDRLEIDTWNGTAWIGITPFVLRGLRPPFLPSLPWVSQSLEINVRTYVHLNGAPGIWFFSLDASNPLAVWGARMTYSLPYFRAEMEFREEGDRIEYVSRRTHGGASAAHFSAAWTRGDRLPEAQPDTRDFFLIERYCLYAASGDRLYRARIHHPPWPLRSAELLRLDSTMIESFGLKAPDEPPLLHAQADPLHVSVWPPERV